MNFTIHFNIKINLDEFIKFLIYFYTLEIKYI